MRKTVVSEMVSLDGYFAGPNGESDWHLADEEFEQFALERLNEMDAIIFGRVTYQLMASYWPTAQTSHTGVIKSNEGVEFAVPAAVSKVHSQIADKMNNLPKIVFSRTL